MAFRYTRQLCAAAKSTGSVPKSTFTKNWLSDSATYPILGIMASAIGLVAFQGQRILLGHPDITFDKHDRMSAIRENDDAAESHHESFVRTRARGGDTQIMTGLNNVMVSGKVKN